MHSADTQERMRFAQSASASLVITVLNEASSLPRFLDSVSRQNPPPAELVVVDGGSTDATLSLLRDWAPPLGTHLKVIEAPGASISAGRNIAIANAAREHILVSDGGTTLDALWVHNLVAALEAGADVASGFFRIAEGGTPMTRIIGSIITPNRVEIEGGKFLPSSRSLGLSRSAWESVGGYPEWLDYCEDLVFDLELKDAGFKFEFVPQATVTWDARPTLSAYAKQYYRYARGDGKANLWRKRHVIRYLSYGTGLMLVGLAFLWPASLLLLGAGLAAAFAKYVGRVLRSKTVLRGLVAQALLMVPIVVVVGDVAKMLGYPVGLAWRVTHRPLTEEV